MTNNYLEDNAELSATSQVDGNAYILTSVPQVGNLDSGGGGGYSRPWELTMVTTRGDDGSITEQVANFTHCRFMRGPFFLTVDDQSADLTGLEGWGPHTIYVRLNTNNHEVDTVEASDSTEGEDRYCDLTYETLDEFIRVPLYEIKRRTLTSPWEVTWDYRDLSLTLHV